MAPEAVTERGPAGEQLDVFSLGAIAFHLFSGRPPASGFVEMTERLRREQGLRISSVLDGAGESLQLLVQYATHPEVTTRLGSAGDFLKELEHVEEELTRPEARSRPDPIEARPEDVLDHDLVMKRRLGKGATALALLVEHGGREHVLKVALSPEHNDRLRAEAGGRPAHGDRGVAYEPAVRRAPVRQCVDGAGPAMRRRRRTVSPGTPGCARPARRPRRRCCFTRAISVKPGRREFPAGWPNRSPIPAAGSWAS